MNTFHFVFGTGCMIFGAGIGGLADYGRNFNLFIAIVGIAVQLCGIHLINGEEKLRRVSLGEKK
jgi:hypothetical protein